MALSSVRHLTDETGLRPPKGCGRSGRAVGYGPQAGEGLVATEARGTLHR